MHYKFYSYEINKDGILDVKRIDTIQDRIITLYLKTMVNYYLRKLQNSKHSVIDIAFLQYSYRFSETIGNRLKRTGPISRNTTGMQIFVFVC